MHYENIVPATFLSRPNRFIANVELNGQPVVCHVKNTGRCRELLTPGATVFLQHRPGAQRKTAYDLIAVYKGDLLINMDAAAPNQVLGEWLAAGGLGEIPTLIKPEAKYGQSRLDFYVELGRRKIFLEVKGVTLETDGLAAFPDAPTERGVKHLHELMACVREGYEAMAVFVIQMKGVHTFAPNWATHREFGETLLQAQAAGVKILALDCKVAPDFLQIDGSVALDLRFPASFDCDTKK